MIWLPTQSARNHLEKNKASAANCVEVVRDGKVVPELLDVFRLIKDYDAVLGTAHVSPEECFIVTEAARDAGVKKIVVTHPEWWLVGMSLEDQVRIVRDYDVILEHCYAQPLGGGRHDRSVIFLFRGDLCSQRGIFPSADRGFPVHTQEQSEYRQGYDL